MELRGTIRCYLVITVFVIGLSAFAGDGVTRAADWPNWRGPEHNGISKEKNWSTDWPKEGPKFCGKLRLEPDFLPSRSVVAEPIRWAIRAAKMLTRRNMRILCFVLTQRVAPNFGGIRIPAR